MPSIVERGNGRFIIQSKVSGRRQTIRLNGLQFETAESLRKKVEHLEEAKQLNKIPQAEILEWLRGLQPEVRRRFIEIELVADRLAEFILPKNSEPQKPSQTAGAGSRPRSLGRFLFEYVEKQARAKKPNTVRHLNDVARKLVEYFGRDVALREITPGHAADWRDWLKSPNEAGKIRAENTVSRWCGRAKQFFKAAIDRKLISENPFKGLRTRVRANKARQVLVDRQLSSRVMAAMPDAQWRLLFALCRFGGLRCPSEILPLTWADVQIDGGWLHVRSPKTEHHDGHGERWVPIFPELRPYLAALVPNEQDPGARLITISKNPKVNFATQFKRYLAKAGIQPWTKLFNNLRSTRQTELQDHFPPQTVSAWMGNSQAVAKENYLQVTDAHVARALADPTGAMPETIKGRCKGALQTPLSPPSAISGPEPLPPESPGKSRVQRKARDCTGLQKVPPVGLEPTT